MSILQINSHAIDQKSGEIWTVQADLQPISFKSDRLLELVDTMGRAVHPGKRGLIPATTPPLLSRLGMDAEAFIACADHFVKDFASAVGTPAKLIEIAAHRQQRALRGLAAARRVFETRAA